MLVRGSSWAQFSHQYRGCLIWLRQNGPNETDMSEFNNNDQKNLGRLSHICASLGQGVSVILVSTVSLASQSYHCKLWFKRLTHISLISTPRVSLISVSIGLVWRSHIRDLPISNIIFEGWKLTDESFIIAASQNDSLRNPFFLQKRKKWKVFLI